MADNLVIRAREALLEGDRDETLRLLKNMAEDAEVLWLRAHAAKTDQERLGLLSSVVSRYPDSIFANLASSILEREAQYKTELAQPPEYQFWKQPTWQGRLDALRHNKVQLIAILSILFFSFLLILLWIGRNTQLAAQQATQAAWLTQTAVVTQSMTPPPPTLTTAPTLTPTITALPPSKRPVPVSYPAGQLSLLRVEFPTNRPVTFAAYNIEGAATPAVGAIFVAVQLEFRCSIPLCEEPPQAQIALRLDDGQIVRYASGNRPVLKEQPTIERVSAGQSVTGWFVFEVPAKRNPSTILVITGDEDPVLELLWPR